MSHLFLRSSSISSHLQPDLVRPAVPQDLLAEIPVLGLFVDSRSVVRVEDLDSNL